MLRYQDACTGRKPATAGKGCVMKCKPVLTTSDHINMDAFLGHAFDGYKAGQIPKYKPSAL
jgi:hypothetical protein